MGEQVRETAFAVIVSANVEWEAITPTFSHVRMEQSPYGEYFFAPIEGHIVLFFLGGWGKVAAAASAQYVIDHFNPRYLINLGTCGGIEGRVGRFDVIAVERVVIYDIHEAMGDLQEAIAHYTTDIEIPAELAASIARTTMYSGDRDLTPSHLLELEKKYRPRVVDWESGAIAWVAKRNKVPVLILRGVTDLVSLDKGEAEANLSLFRDNARQVMQGLVSDLPRHLAVLSNR
jgi:adenosylhomocysteine nucleosidase